MQALYSATEDSRGEIAIAASPEEWRAVVHRITQISPAVEDDSDKLVYLLINQGVYE